MYKHTYRISNWGCWTGHDYNHHHSSDPGCTWCPTINLGESARGCPWCNIWQLQIQIGGYSNNDIHYIYTAYIYKYMSKYHNGDHIILMVTWYRIIYTNGDHNDNFHNLLMLVSYGITFPVRTCDICCSSGCWCYAISTKWFPETHLGDIIVLPQKPWPILECQAKKHE